MGCRLILDPVRKGPRDGLLSSVSLGHKRTGGGPLSFTRSYRKVSCRFPLGLGCRGP